MYTAACLAVTLQRAWLRWVGTGLYWPLHSVHVATFHRISGGSWTVFVVLAEPEPDLAPAFSCEIQVAAVELPEREVRATQKGPGTRQTLLQHGWQEHEPQRSTMSLGRSAQRHTPQHQPEGSRALGALCQRSAGLKVKAAPWE